MAKASGDLLEARQPGAEDVAPGWGGQQRTVCLASQEPRGKGMEAAGSAAIKPETSCVIPHTHHLTESLAGQLGWRGPSHVTAGALGSDKT